MAAEIGDTIEFVVDNHLLPKLMYEDSTLAVEDEAERKLGVSVQEIFPADQGKLRVVAKIAWIDAPEEPDSIT